VQKGREAFDQINILGDDAVPIEYHEQFWRSEVIDFIILQQDAFDKIDQNCPIDRQKYMLNLVIDICEQDFQFENFQQVGDFFKQMINTLKQMNYSEFESDQFNEYRKQLDESLSERKAVHAD